MLRWMDVATAFLSSPECLVWWNFLYLFGCFIRDLSTLVRLQRWNITTKFMFSSQIYDDIYHWTLQFLNAITPKQFRTPFYLFVTSQLYRLDLCEKVDHFCVSNERRHCFIQETSIYILSLMGSNMRSMLDEGY